MRTGTVIAGTVALIAGAVCLLRMLPDRPPPHEARGARIRTGGAADGESRHRVAYGRLWPVIATADTTGTAGEEAPPEESVARPPPSPADAVEADAGKPLVIDYPTPLFDGSIAELGLDAADPREYEGTIAVASGTSLISRGKPVTSSDPEPVLGELQMITDGDKQGYEGSYVELTPGRQYVQIDLLGDHLVDAIAVWHYHAEPRFYHDVVVMVSGNPSFTGSTTLFNNDRDNSSGAGEGHDDEYLETHRGLLIPARGIAARYVRLYSNGNSTDRLNHYIEVEVYGMPTR